MFCGFVTYRNGVDWEEKCVSCWRASVVVGVEEPWYPMWLELYLGLAIASCPAVIEW